MVYQIQCEIMSWDSKVTMFFQKSRRLGNITTVKITDKIAKEEAWNYEDACVLTTLDNLSANCIIEMKMGERKNTVFLFTITDCEICKNDKYTP